MPITEQQAIRLSVLHDDVEEAAVLAEKARDRLFKAKAKFADAICELKKEPKS